jgi:hypothetical protein
MVLLLKIVQRRYCIVSIIYDALKKTQNKRDVAIQGTHRSKRTLGKGVGVIIISSLFISLFIYSPVIIKKFKSKPLSIVSAKIPPLALNGVFISPKSRLVEINQQFFQVGEVVNGMKILSISYNKITFRKGDKLLELQVPV